MAEKEKYIAITIGPIFETLSLVSKPAGLWGASYLFSYITEQLTKKIQEKQGYEILTPYFEFDEVDGAFYQASRGAGFYHDHIIVKNGDLECIGTIIKKVKAELGENIYYALRYDIKNEYSEDNKEGNRGESIAEASTESEDKYDINKVKTYINDYIRIYATEYETEESEISVINELSVLFDGMELRCQTVPVEKENYIASFLDNDKIRYSFLVERLKNKGPGDWQLFRNTSDYGIKTLPDIARSDGDPKQWKRYSYYAYVISDGDHMGTVLSQLKSTESVRSFSQNCLLYNTKACKCIEEYGGIVVYAGGDDLRFLVPLTKYDRDAGCQKTVFDLIMEIKECFEDVFVVKREGVNISASPTISFGVAITYHKYPLYETGNMAEDLLFTAKDSGRDSLSIYVQKHSGQSAKFVIHNLSKSKNTNGLLSDLRDVIGARINNTSMNSVLSHITQYTGLLDFAMQQQQRGDSGPIDSFFKNVFADDTALSNEKTRDAIKQIACDALPADIKSLHSDLNTNEGRSVPERVWPVIDLLRTAQLFGEAGDPRNE